MTPTITDAIIALGFNGGFKIKDNKIAVWYRDDTQPTQSTIDAKLAELQAEYDAQAYARARKDEYPSYAEQFDILYHKGVAGLKAELKKTKDKYPKLKTQQ